MCGQIVILFLGLVGAERELVVDAFRYPDAAAAQQAWQAGFQTPPVRPVVGPDGTGLEFSLPFGKQPTLERTVHDRQVQLDLSVPVEFRLQISVEDPEAVGHVTLYFRSGAGWYAGGANVAEKGWQTLRFPKASFRPEDNPAGWDQIDGIRISCWRGAALDSVARLGSLKAVWHDVAVVVPDADRARGDRELASAAKVAETVSRLLAESGLAFDTLTDRQVRNGCLGSRCLAIIPYHPRLDEKTTDELVSFVQGGGKVFVCYSVPLRLAGALGFGNMRYVPQKRRGQFAAMHFVGAEVPGIPEVVRQASWNITAAEPTAADARVVGQWYDDQGRDTGQPALLLSPRGAMLTHIVLGDDPAAKRQLLAAVVGKLCPQLWEEMADSALERLQHVGHVATLDALRQLVQAEGDRQAGQLLAKAEAAVAQAEKLFSRARHGEGLEGYPLGLAQLAEARRWLVDAYVRSQPSPQAEGRAVWNHSGTGAFPGDWERTARALADAGFNMVLPNMLWAGRAHYASDVLPRSKTFQQYGDQIAQCVAACHKVGLEVHVWKVNHNLSGAPREFVEKLRREGRTQVTVDGKPYNWLCPSHPANFQLELESMLEVVRKYDVDGLHFDYIRYPGSQCCYCDGCRKRFEQAIGRSVDHWPEDCYSGPLREAYRQWRCDNITRLVAAVSREARKIKPQIKISAAVFGAYPACRDSVGQDWVAWVKAGYLDFVCPMDYTQDDAYFVSLVKNQLQLVAGRIPVYPGIGAWRLTPERVVGQIHYARSLGAPGFTIFNLTEEAAKTFLPAVAAGAGRRPATPPHHAAGRGESE